MVGPGRGIILIEATALLIFGFKKLPEIGRAAGIPSLICLLFQRACCLAHMYQ